MKLTLPIRSAHRSWPWTTIVSGFDAEMPVSFPSWELFQAQPADYQASVLPPGISARVAVEAASAFGWERYVGTAGQVVGIDHFGASAPAKVLGREFGFTVERVVAAGRQVLSGRAAATRS